MYKFVKMSIYWYIYSHQSNVIFYTSLKLHYHFTRLTLLIWHIVTTLSCHLFFVLLVLILYLAGVDILPLVFERLPLDIPDNEEFLKGLAWNQRDSPGFIYDVSVRKYSFKTKKYIQSKFTNIAFTLHCINVLLIYAIILFM